MTTPVMTVAPLLLAVVLVALQPCAATNRRPRHYTEYAIQVHRSPSLVFGGHVRETFVTSARSQAADDRCCSLGYRSQWVSLLQKRRVISYCPDHLPCCPHLVDKEVVMWGGIGFSLCVKGEKKEERKPVMNPFTRFLGYPLEADKQYEDVY